MNSLKVNRHFACLFLLLLRTYDYRSTQEDTVKNACSNSCEFLTVNNISIPRLLKGQSWLIARKVLIYVNVYTEGWDSTHIFAKMFYAHKNVLPLQRASVAGSKKCLKWRWRRKSLSEHVITMGDRKMYVLSHCA